MEISGKQVGTVIISLIFVMSAISIAFSWQPTTQANSQESSNVINSPLSNEMRLLFPEEGVTIMTVFYVNDNSDSLAAKKDAENMKDEFGENLMVEVIDVETYQSFSAAYNVRTVPVVLIRGKSNMNAPIRLEGLQDFSMLKERVCSTFEEKPDACL